MLRTRLRPSPGEVKGRFASNTINPASTPANTSAKINGKACSAVAKPSRHTAGRPYVPNTTRARGNTKMTVPNANNG